MWEWLVFSASLICVRDGVRGRDVRIQQARARMQSVLRD